MLGGFCAVTFLSAGFVVVRDAYAFLGCCVREYGVVVAHEDFYACLASWLVSYLEEFFFELVGECLVGVSSALDFLEAKLRVLDCLSVCPVAENDCLVASSEAVFVAVFFL